MKISKYINCSKEEVDSKKFNIWIGISLRNKFFTKENIENYISWALEKTDKEILIVIADRIEAINIEVLDNYSKLRAFKVAYRKGDEKEKEIQEIIEKLPEEKRKLINIARFRDIENTKYFGYRIEIMKEEFKKKGKFYDEMMNLTRDHWKNGPHTLTTERLEKLSEYFIYEIQLFLNGAKFGGLPEKGGKTYLLHVYPFFSKFDEFLIDCQEGKSFPELTKKLKLNGKFIMVEMH
jgi:tRNA-dependent cyclodipeptide synthase